MIKSDEINKESPIHLGGTARSPEEVERIHGLGLQFAEIPINKPMNFQGEADHYRAQADRLGLYFLCHGPREGDPNDIEGLEHNYLPKILEIFPLMKTLNSRLLTIHLWLDRRHVKEEVIRYKRELLKRITERAERYHITICLENLSEKASDLLIPLQELPSLGLTLDLGHAQLLTDENTSYEFIKNHSKRIKHIHLHDNRGGDSHMDDLHLPPGEGVIDFGKIFKHLFEAGYSETVTLELKPREIEECLDSVKGRIKKARRS